MLTEKKGETVESQWKHKPRVANTMYEHEAGV